MKKITDIRFPRKIVDVVIYAALMIAAFYYLDIFGFLILCVTLPLIVD